MATRKHLPLTAASMEAADPAQDGDRDDAGVHAIPKAAGPTASEQAFGDAGAMAETGEMDQLRLQMKMDRKSKMMSTLTNVAQRTGDAQDQITKNIK